MTNEEILAGAIFFMNGNRKDRININATGKKFELGHYAMTEFKKFLRENHPEMLNLSPQYDAVHPDMHKVGIFQMICKSTNRRVIASTKHSFLHASHLHLHYIRNCQKFSMNNMYSKCAQAKNDIEMYGPNDFKFEILEIISNEQATAAYLRLRREQIIQMFDDEVIYKTDAKKTRELLLCQIMDHRNNFSQEIKDLAIAQDHDTKLLQSLQNSMNLLIQHRIKLQEELNTAVRRKPLINRDIRNLNGQKKILRERLNDLQKKVSTDRRRLNQLLNAHELLNLKPVGRPPSK